MKLTSRFFFIASISFVLGLWWLHGAKNTAYDHLIERWSNDAACAFWVAGLFMILAIVSGLSGLLIELRRKAKTQRQSVVERQAHQKDEAEKIFRRISAETGTPQG